MTFAAFFRRQARTAQKSGRPRRRTIPLSLEALEDRCLLSTITVINPLDNGDNVNPIAGSLRAAILEANSSSPSTIKFDLGGQTPIFTPPLALPDVTADGVAIFATPSQNIELNGMSAGNVAGLTLAGNGDRVTGLNIVQFGAAGIQVKGSGETIDANFIGTSLTGDSGVGNGGDGVLIESSAASPSTNNSLTDNVIAGNDGNGVSLTGAGTSNNSLVNNYIGIAFAPFNNGDGSGPIPLPNMLDGVAISDGASNNWVGGAGLFKTSPRGQPISGAGNVISANLGNGVSLSGAGTTLNQVQGNLIGTDLPGTSSIPNGVDGVALSDGASDNLIGGIVLTAGTLGRGNVISGNKLDGVDVRGSGTSGNQIQGNFIGTDFSGVVRVGNFVGVVIEQGASDNAVGGARAGQYQSLGNRISGNWSTGRSTWIVDVALDANFPRGPLAQAEGLYGAFACPLLAGSDVVGVIEFFCRDVRHPDPDLLEMMSTVGGQIGQFLRRKEAEAELHRGEARKAAMLAAALDAIITIDHEERILEFNPAAERIFGYPRGAALGQRLSELIIPSAYRAAHRRGMQHYLESGEGPVLGRRVEMPALRADGSEFPAEISIVPTVLDGRPIFTGYLRDITERRRAEEALRASEARFRAIFEQSPLGMEICAPNGALLRVNRALEQMVGISGEALIRYKVNVLNDPQVKAGGGLPFLQRGFGGEVTRAPTILFTPRQSVDGPGAKSIWIGAIIFPLKDEAGRIVEVLVILEDETERKCAEEEILQLNRDLEQRVTARTAELKSANAQLARAAKLKDEFFATVSHELRTPLGGVIGMVELLAETPLDEKQRRYAHVAHTSAGLLRDVINDILDFSRIEAGQLQLERMDFSPAEVVREVISILALQAADKGLDLHCHLDAGVDAWLSGDRGRLRQVLVNLVANAVKFTERGAVVVRVAVVRGGVTRREWSEETTHLRFAVSDSGIGIPRDQLDRLFQAFSQVDASTSRRYGGSGLGLAICRRLTELMGGTIGVESVPGQGSTFWFTIPLSPPQAPRPPKGSARAGASDVGVPSRALRILLAEDNAANQLVAMALLESAGHSVRVAHDGRQALAAHAEERFDLILMDVQMPQVDGLQATREIRRREAGRATPTPIIAVTAHADKGDQDRFLAAGMDGCLIKPVARRELAGVLEALFPAELSRALLPPAPPAQADGHKIDWAAVLARLEGNEALLADIIDLYVKEWPRLFAESRQALDGGELGAVAFKAHRLNGLTRNFGVGPAAAAAANVEALANQGESEAIRRAGDELQAVCVLLEREVCERRRTLDISVDRTRG